jgi:hypothetical protein
LFLVFAGIDPAIHEESRRKLKRVVDARVKAAHDA